MQLHTCQEGGHHPTSLSSFCGRALHPQTATVLVYCRLISHQEKKDASDSYVNNNTLISYVSKNVSSYVTWKLVYDLATPQILFPIINIKLLHITGFMDAQCRYGGVLFQDGNSTHGYKLGPYCNAQGWGPFQNYQSHTLTMSHPEAYIVLYEYQGYTAITI